MKKGLIHIFTGDGRGKTTAAVGLALRARGAGKKVCFIQFLKAKVSSEIPLLKKSRVEVISFKEKHPLFYKSASRSTLKERVAKDLIKTKAILKSRKYNFIILDEVLCLLREKLAKEEKILNLIKSRLAKQEIVLTGRSAPKSIIRIADYVSNIKAVKHPYKKGIYARLGTEY